MREDTILCRCEEVTYGDVQDAINHGLIDPGDIRKYTRAGMGSCQGRTCWRLLIQKIRQATGNDCLLDDSIHARAPAQSMTVKELSVYREEPEE